MGGKDSTHIETSCVHSGRAPDPSTGAVIPPLHLATTFIRDDEGGWSNGWKYTRYANPTRAALETCVAELERGTAACAFSSGMAAAHALFQPLRPGDRVVVSQDAYHGVLRLLRESVAPLGIRIDSVDFSDETALADALSTPATVVWAETPSNPLLKLCDLTRVAELAHGAGAIAVCDNTFATPVLQRPLELGFDVSMHSMTKYLGGHSDVLAGALVFREAGAWYERVHAVQMGAGAVASPFDSWLVQRGIATLALRVRAQSASAQALSEWLLAHPRVERVHYPFAPTHPQRALAERQMAMGGGVLSVEVRGDAMRVANATRLFRHATSLGGVESLIEHRASVEGPGTRTPANLLRLSVGIEHVDDLRDDLDSALGA